MQIVVNNKANKNQRLRVPWLPEEITFNSGATRVQQYEIVNLGELEIPRGTNLKSVSWSSQLPGKAHKSLPFLKYNSSDKWKNPNQIVTMLDGWRKSGTVLTLKVYDDDKSKTVSFINMDVILSDFDATLSGSYGDIEYSVTFKEYRAIKVSTSAVAKSAKKKKAVKKKAIPKTYKIKKGDTLYKISVKFWGNGSHKNELYKLNKKKLNKVAKKHGRKNSKKGKYLYKGTKIKLRKK